MSQIECFSYQMVSITLTGTIIIAIVVVGDGKDMEDESYNVISKYER